MQIPRRKSEELRRKVEGPLHITEKGLSDLKEKLARLKSALPEYVAETQRAAAFGDRSENDEYKEAKSRLTRTHWQILTITDQIKRAAIIPSGKNTSGIVKLGSSVVLKMSDGLETFRIVGPYETNPSLGRISFQSPLGAALMNHKKGDIVAIKTPVGSKNYIIIDIK
ncbi:MAG: GreA/GreB family elongation factor [Patescibacteria group bacterium]